MNFIHKLARSVHTMSQIYEQLYFDIGFVKLFWIRFKFNSLVFQELFIVAYYLALLHIYTLCSFLHQGDNDPHCGYFNTYISQKIRLYVVDLEGQFQTTLQTKDIKKFTSLACRIVWTLPSKSTSHKTKTLFWFRSDTKIDRYFQLTP